MFAAFVVYWLWIGQHVRTHTHSCTHILLHTPTCATLALACSHINALPCNFIKFSFFIFSGLFFFFVFLFLFWASELTNGSRLTERAMLLFIKPYDAHISPHTQIHMHTYYILVHRCTNIRCTLRKQNEEERPKVLYPLRFLSSLILPILVVYNGAEMNDIVSILCLKI